MFGTFTYYKVIQLPCLPASWYKTSDIDGTATAAETKSGGGRASNRNIYEDEEEEDDAMETARLRQEAADWRKQKEITSQRKQAEFAKMEARKGSVVTAGVRTQF